MAGATFSRVKTWIAGETLTASDLNAEFNNFLNNLKPSGIDDESANDAAAQATSDPYAGDSLAKATSLQGEIQQLRYLIAQITGETYWYVDPDSDIATIHAALNGGLDPVNIDDESADDAAARATKDPYADSSLVKATSLQEEIQELRYLIAQITGESYWYIDPDNNIATIHAALFEAGTTMVFGQTTPPVGWTRKGDWQDNAMLCYAAAGAIGSGGAANPQSTHTHTGPSHTHTGPSHTHLVSGNTGGPSAISLRTGGGANTPSDTHTHSVSITSNAGGTGATGSSGTDATGANTAPYYQEVIAATKD